MSWRPSLILGGRPDKRPGEFKLYSNQAGNTVFVAPDLVEGTLRRGYEILDSLTTPTQRGTFAAVLVAEVHPLDDGNGRLARAVMNAEDRGLQLLDPATDQPAVATAEPG